MTPNPRTYEQLCPVALALDVIEHRWAVLILRDLLWRGPHGFQQLVAANPGISTSVLSRRLSDLTEAGLIETDPRSDTQYRLTPQGRNIRGVIDAMYAFGAQLLPNATMTPAKLRYLIELAAKSVTGQIQRLHLDTVVRLEVDGAQIDVELAPGVMRVVQDTATDASVSLLGAEFVAILTRQASPCDLTGRHFVGKRAAGETLLGLLVPPPANE